MTSVIDPPDARGTRPIEALPPRAEPRATSIAVRVESVRRTFVPRRSLGRRGEEFVALDDVSLAVGEGEVLGLLGPNGAGKTTLVKILSTVLLPTSGRVEVLGHDVVRDTRAVRTHIGIVFGGERGLYPGLTPRETLRYWAALYRVSGRQARERCDRLLERVGLLERADDRVETFSRGMKQRLHLARGLVGDPRVLFLDEPTTGMDPVAAREFRALVGELNREGRTIFVTTHDMAEAEAICDRVALIEGGKILAVAEPNTLSRWVSALERVCASGVSEAARSDIERLPGARLVGSGPNGAIVAECERDAIREVLELLVRDGVTDLRTERPSLEDVYVHVFGGRGLGV